MNIKHNSCVTILSDDHRIELLKLAAKMACCREMPSPFLEDWHLPQTTPKRVMRQIQNAADKADTQCKGWAVTLRRIIDEARCP